MGGDAFHDPGGVLEISRWRGPLGNGRSFSKPRQGRRNQGRARVMSPFHRPCRGGIGLECRCPVAHATGQSPRSLRDGRVCFPTERDGRRGAFRAGTGGVVGDDGDDEQDAERPRAQGEVGRTPGAGVIHFLRPKPRGCFARSHEGSINTAGGRPLRLARDFTRTSTFMPYSRRY